MVDPVGVDIESADLLGVVDAGGLSSLGCLRDADHLENRALLVIDIGEVGSSVVRAKAVIASRLAHIVLAEQLIERRAGVIDRRELTIGIAEAMGYVVRQRNRERKVNGETALGQCRPSP